MKTRDGAACLALLLGAALLSSCGEKEAVAARVDGREISISEAAEKLRGLLWRKGEEWDDLKDAEKQTRRREAVEACINEHLLAAFAQTHPAPAAGAQAEEEFQQFLKQFEPPDGWEKRAALQGLNATTLKKRIAGESAQTLALEHWLSAQSPRITEADARTWYEAHRTSLTVPEQVRASEIFLTRSDHEKDTPDHIADIDRSAEIREIAKKLKAHEGTFGELAGQYSQDDGSKKRGGDMGWFSRERLPKEFVEKVFALPVGQVSEPFESHLGWHIVLVQEKRPTRPAEFAEMKDEIMAMLESHWRDDMLAKLRQKLRAEAKIEMFDIWLLGLNPE